MKNHPFQPLYGKKGVEETLGSSYSPTLKEPTKQRAAPQQPPASLGQKQDKGALKQIPATNIVLKPKTLNGLSLGSKQTWILIAIIILVLLIIAVFAYRQRQQQIQLAKLKRKLRRLA